MSEPSTNSSEPEPNQNRKAPFPQGFLDNISRSWADTKPHDSSPLPQAPFAKTRRDQLSAMFPGKRLVIPAGSLKVRSNDTDYPFRAHSAFAHLSGWGSDSEADSVLVFDPREDGTHDYTLFFRERAGRDTEEFYADASIGEFWIGPRPSLTEVSSRLGIKTADLAEFSASDADLVIAADSELDRAVSELRLVKDSYEQDQLREAVAVTAAGFDDIIRALPEAISHPRGERVVEGAFHSRARKDGNAEGYDTIAAAGDHACYLHWTRNDGQLRDGELILVDAGVELDSLYTADITRTIPISGVFSPVQARVYQAVLDAADAAFAAAKVGVKFRDVHAAAMEVIAQRLSEWGILPVSVAEALDAERGGQHRRYMVHGTSHHLGLDVHDCAKARREMYYDGELVSGMVFTIEPGLYFQSDDLTVPEEYRGIGVRIEDDILMGEHGPENLSREIPRTVADVEAWVQRLR